MNLTSSLQPQPGSAKIGKKERSAKKGDKQNKTVTITNTEN
jgi:hypothetical protein